MFRTVSLTRRLRLGALAFMLMASLSTGASIGQVGTSKHDGAAAPYCPVDQNGIMVCDGPKPEAYHVPKAKTAEVGWEDFISAKLFMGAYDELRCEGIADRQARQIYQRRYAERERRITIELTRRYGSTDMDRVLVQHKCPYYRGAGTRYDAALGRLERSLGLAK